MTRRTFAAIAVSATLALGLASTALAATPSAGYGPKPTPAVDGADFLAWRHSTHAMRTLPGDADASDFLVLKERHRTE